MITEQQKQQFILQVLCDQTSYKAKCHDLIKQVQSNELSDLNFAIQALKFTLESSSTPPMCKLLGMRLIQELMNANNASIFQQVQQFLFEPICQIGMHDCENPDMRRGASLFGHNQKKQIQDIGEALLILVLDCIYVWSVQYSDDSVFRSAYDNLKAVNVSFPKKITNFASDKIVKLNLTNVYQQSNNETDQELLNQKEQENRILLKDLQAKDTKIASYEQQVSHLNSQLQSSQAVIKQLHLEQSKIQIQNNNEAEQQLIYQNEVQNRKMVQDLQAKDSMLASYEQQVNHLNSQLNQAQNAILNSKSSQMNSIEKQQQKQYPSKELTMNQTQETSTWENKYNAIVKEMEDLCMKSSCTNMYHADRLLFIQMQNELSLALQEKRVLQNIIDQNHYVFFDQKLGTPTTEQSYKQQQQQYIDAMSKKDQEIMNLKQVLSENLLSDKESKPNSLVYQNYQKKVNEMVDVITQLRDTCQQRMQDLQQQQIQHQQERKDTIESKKVLCAELEASASLVVKLKEEIQKQENELKDVLKENILLKEQLLQMNEAKQVIDEQAWSVVLGDKSFQAHGFQEKELHECQHSVSVQSQTDATKQNDNNDAREEEFVTNDIDEFDQDAAYTQSNIQAVVVQNVSEEVSVKALRNKQPILAQEYIVPQQKLAISQKQAQGVDMKTELHLSHYFDVLLSNKNVIHQSKRIEEYSQQNAQEQQFNNNNQIQFDQSLFQVLQFAENQRDANQIILLQKAFLNLKQLLYVNSNDALKIGVITQVQSITENNLFLVLSVYFTNTSTMQANQIEIQYHGDSNNELLYASPQILPDFIAPLSQVKQDLLFSFQDIPFDLLTLNISYTSNGVQIQREIFLPTTILKFLKEVNSSLTEFCNLWQQCSRINKYSTEFLPINQKLLPNGINDLPQLFPAAIKLDNKTFGLCFEILSINVQQRNKSFLLQIMQEQNLIQFIIVDLDECFDDTNQQSLKSERITPLNQPSIYLNFILQSLMFAMTQVLPNSRLQ